MIFLIYVKFYTWTAIKISNYGNLGWTFDELCNRRRLISTLCTCNIINQKTAFGSKSLVFSQLVISYSHDILLPRPGRRGCSFNYGQESEKQGNDHWYHCS